MRRMTCCHGSNVDASSEAGFTLLELMVVLAILSLTITAAAVSFGNSGTTVRLQPLAVRVAADLKLARAEAMTQSRPVGVAFDPKTNAYQVAGGRAVLLPRSVAFKLVTPEAFRRLTDSAQLVFFADGSSTGGELTLSDGRQSVTLLVDWLTGSVLAKKPES